MKNRKALTTPIVLGTEIRLDDLVLELAGKASQAALVEFIKTLDLEIADWGFTRELIQHFKEQDELFKKESSQ